VEVLQRKPLPLHNSGHADPQHGIDPFQELQESDPARRTSGDIVVAPPEIRIFRDLQAVYHQAAGIQSAYVFHKGIDGLMVEDGVHQGKDPGDHDESLSQGYPVFDPGLHDVQFAPDLAQGIIIKDTWNNRIVIYDQLGSFRYQIQGGTVFRSPIDLAVDPDGYIFVLAWREGERSIVRLDFDGLFIEEIPVPTDEVADVPPEPVSISISPAGDRLYLLDRSAHRLWITGRDGEVVGSADLSGESTDEELQERVYGHVDAYGDRVLVANATLGRILLFDLEGNPQGHVGRKGTATCQSAFPTGGAMNRDGEVFILDKQRMLFWDAHKGLMFTNRQAIAKNPLYAKAYYNHRRAPLQDIHQLGY